MYYINLLKLQIDSALTFLLANINISHIDPISFWTFILLNKIFIIFFLMIYLGILADSRFALKNKFFILFGYIFYLLLMYLLRGVNISLINEIF